MTKMGSIPGMGMAVRKAGKTVWNVLYLSADGVVRSYIREVNN